MTIYLYKAVSVHGRRARGSLHARNLIDLEARLKQAGLDLITGRPARILSHLPSARVPVRERLQFCFHLEQLLRAGVPLLESLGEVREATTDSHLRKVVADLIESVGGGQSLSQALAEHASVFDPVFCALVRAGEAAGRLPDVLREIYATLKREDELRAFARKMIIYPAFVTMTSLAAVAVSLVYVVPELAKLFRSVGLDLPLQTRLLVWLSDGLARHWLLLLGPLTGLAVALPVVLRLHAGLARRWDRMRLSLPLFGPIYRKIVLSRFASLFATLYDAGITILDTLRLARATLGNRVLQDALERVEIAIAEGQSLAAAFAAAELFPTLVVRMLRIGEHTGALDQSLRAVSYFYERDVRESTESVQALMEPLILLVLGGLMLWIAMAILGPIYDIITRLKV